MAFSRLLTAWASSCPRPGPRSSSVRSPLPRPLKRGVRRSTQVGASGVRSASPASRGIFSTSSPRASARACFWLMERLDRPVLATVSAANAFSCWGPDSRPTARQVGEVFPPVSRRRSHSTFRRARCAFKSRHVAHQPRDLPHVPSRCLRLRRIAAMLAGVAVTPGCAGIRTAVHPATPLPLHCRRLALRSRAGPG